MLDGYIDFFMDPNLADSYVKLKEELDKLLQKKASFLLNFKKEILCSAALNPVVSLQCAA